MREGKEEEWSEVGGWDLLVATLLLLHVSAHIGITPIWQVLTWVWGTWMAWEILTECGYLLYYNNHDISSQQKGYILTCRKMNTKAEWLTVCRSVGVHGAGGGRWRVVRVDMVGLWVHTWWEKHVRVRGGGRRRRRARPGAHPAVFMAEHVGLGPDPVARLVLVRGIHTTGVEVERRWAWEKQVIVARRRERGARRGRRGGAVVWCY